MKGSTIKESRLSQLVHGGLKKPSCGQGDEQGFAENSGEDRNMSAWRRTTVGEVATGFLSGGTPTTKRPEYWQGNIPWITSKWLGDDLELNDGEKFVTEEAVKKTSTKIVPKDSIIFATRVGVGKIGINLINLAINQDLAGVLIDNDKIDIKFLAYQLGIDSIQQYVAMNKRGATINGITRDCLKEIRLNLPPLPEQKKIAYVLSTVQRAIEVSKSKKATLQALFRTLLHELMTAKTRVHNLELPQLKASAEDWGMMDGNPYRLPETWSAATIGGVTVKAKQRDPRKTPANEFQYVDVSSVSNESFKITGATLTVGIEAPSRARQELNTDDVLFATVRPTLKRTAVVPKELDGEIASTGYCVLRSNQSMIHPRFLYSFLLTDHFNARMAGLERGANYPAVRDSDVKNSWLPLPPLPEQKKIAHILSTVQQAIEVSESKKATLQALFRTLLHELMTAKIRATSSAIADR